MKAQRGSRAARRAGQAGEVAARDRVDALFERFDRLTPDELARIGLVRADAADREELRAVVAAAARASGRSALASEVRARARDVLLERYAQGGLHPTWLALNWGISQGTAEDRVAIIEALGDAAAAAVVADLVEPDVVDALSLDADHVVAMASGDVSEGSLVHVLAPPATGDPDTARRWAGIAVVAGLVGFVVAGYSLWSFGLGAALVVVAVAAVVLVSARRLRRAR